MRTTIDIEDDVLVAVKELARAQHVSAGEVASGLLREALTGRQSRAVAEGAKRVGGFRPFPARGSVVSNELVNALRDDEGV